MKSELTKFASVAAFGLALALTFIGCVGGHFAYLSKGVPESFFSDTKIDSDDSKKVSYKFESKLADPFQFYKNYVDLNASYKSVLENYMNYKYTSVDSGDGNYHIDVILEKCTYKSVYAGTHGVSKVRLEEVAKVTTELEVTVRVNADGKVSEKKINGMGEFTGDKEDPTTTSGSFDLAIRATISRMDKFLNNAINNATSDP
jgi:hypothetical protein